MNRSKAIRAWSDPVAAAQSARLRYVNGEGAGIYRRRHGKGFEYIDENSKLVRDKKVLERIRALVIPPAWKNVWICPYANGHIQCVGRDARGRKQYRYHADYRQIRDEAKYGRMVAFGAVLPKIRRQVRKDLALPGIQKRKVVAAIVQLLDETCIRVGNDEYAKSNHSYGLTTLKDRHADIHGATVRFHFRGKSGQEHDITLRDRRLAKIVKQCQDLPGQELFQYTAENGERMRVDSSDVNEYLSEITEDDFTAKDFRTWHGTGHMAQKLAETGPAESETEAKRNIVEAVKETARHLGNRPAACRKYYIHPAVLETYLDPGLLTGLRNGRRHSDGSLRGLHPQEVAVLHLVERYVTFQNGKRAKAS